MKWQDIDKKVARLIYNYESERQIDLHNTINAILELADDKQISDELAKKLINALLTIHIRNEIENDIRRDLWESKDSYKTLKVMKLNYGRTTEEIFA